MNQWTRLLVSAGLVIGTALTIALRAPQYAMAEINTRAIADDALVQRSRHQVARLADRRPVVGPERVGGGQAVALRPDLRKRRGTSACR